MPGFGIHISEEALTRQCPANQGLHAKQQGVQNPRVAPVSAGAGRLFPNLAIGQPANAPARTDTLQAMQHTYGNRATQRFIQRSTNTAFTAVQRQPDSIEMPEEVIYGTPPGPIELPEQVIEVPRPGPIELPEQVIEVPGPSSDSIVMPEETIHGTPPDNIVMPEEHIYGTPSDTIVMPEEHIYGRPSDEIVMPEETIYGSPPEEEYVY